MSRSGLRRVNDRNIEVPSGASRSVVMVSAGALALLTGWTMFSIITAPGNGNRASGASAANAAPSAGFGLTGAAPPAAIRTAATRPDAPPPQAGAREAATAELATEMMARDMAARDGAAKDAGREAAAKQAARDTLARELSARAQASARAAPTAIQTAMTPIIAPEPVDANVPPAAAADTPSQMLARAFAARQQGGAPGSGGQSLLSYGSDEAGSAANVPLPRRRPAKLARTATPSAAPAVAADEPDVRDTISAAEANRQRGD